MSSHQNKSLFVGSQPLRADHDNATGSFVRRVGELFYLIRDVDAMDPFFISLVSPYDHWLFAGSQGGISAGRKDPDNALFPYYTDDKILAGAETTGSVTAMWVETEKGWSLWEPFSNRYNGLYTLHRNLYKNKSGNKLIFEEENLDLGLTFEYQWAASQEFGFVKTSRLTRTSENPVKVKVLDGIHNILPSGLGEDLQRNRSTLVDAYKSHHWLPESSLAVFGLGARIIDRAEPSESLLGTTVWSTVEQPVSKGLTTRILKDFRRGEWSSTRDLETNDHGAYLVGQELSISSDHYQQWSFAAEVNQSAANISDLREFLEKNRKGLAQLLHDDIEKTTVRLRRLVGMADGIQKSKDKTTEVRHYFNVLFNIMRGGVFEYNTSVDPQALMESIQHYNPSVYEAQHDFFNGVPSDITYPELLVKAHQTKDPDVIRLCTQFLPLTFSRRHGDPSRPWNRFSIGLDSSDHKPKYEGNWRDIFQNWEALAYSFPPFIEGMIAKFLNASTVDGYNPYRINQDGIDWEVIEPDDPWSYIGYWGDHQIIYLLKLLEHQEKHFPKLLAQQLDKSNYVYANVPYRIKNYRDILNNPRDTIVYDLRVEEIINTRVEKRGEDGKLVYDQHMAPLRATLSDKLLVTFLTKVSNFIPEAGIWLNTQRPEWNDANNALVGNGVSVVTAGYLRRFTAFFMEIVKGYKHSELPIHKEILTWLQAIDKVFVENEEALSQGLSKSQRKQWMDDMGNAAETYRKEMYWKTTSLHKKISVEKLLATLQRILKALDFTLSHNLRPDGLYHAYNLVEYTETEATIGYLYPMLEGQVSIISSGYLDENGVQSVLKSLRESELYTEDQRSYMLYPNRKLTPFFEKNRMDPEFAQKSELVKILCQQKDNPLVEVDHKGNYYFASGLYNREDLSRVLDELANTYPRRVESERALLLEYYESVFNHKSFTGRSGTFFAYEGLGSIYWHMVSKLLLAIHEYIDPKGDSGQQIYLKHMAAEVKEGIGAHKSPVEYGAFPVDPYSHTPAGRGVQQPGMTGQVKEDVLSRWFELGIHVHDGVIAFTPSKLAEAEWYPDPVDFQYIDVNGEIQWITVPEESMGFTYAGIPIIYTRGHQPAITINTNQGEVLEIEGNVLPANWSQSLFERSGEITSLHIQLFPHNS